MTTQLALGLVRKDTSGSARAQRGMRLAETAEAIHDDWVDTADEVIVWLASLGRPFSAETVRRWAGSPTHPNAMGARFNAAARRGIIIKVGTVNATRPERHANEMKLWVGKWTKNGEEVVGYLYAEGPRR